VEDELFESTPVARDQLLIVVGVDHYWGGQGQLTLEDLIAGEWVLREPGSGTRSVFEEAFARLGANPSSLRVQLELPSNGAVRAAVEALGATAISASVAAPSLEAGLLQQVAFRLPERAAGLIACLPRQRSKQRGGFDPRRLAFDASNPGGIFPLSSRIYSAVNRLLRSDEFPCSTGIYCRFVRPGTRFLSRFASAWLLLESRRAPIDELQDPMIFPFGNTKVCHYYFSRSEGFAHAEANRE
jgi:hypothetical protein